MRTNILDLQQSQVAEDLLGVGYLADHLFWGINTMAELRAMVDAICERAERS